jgi:hypothetical protein
MAKGKSIRESLRMEGRDWSLLAAAAALALFGIALSKSIIPAYHEQAAIEKRRAELRIELDKAKQQSEALRSEADAMDDPYYLARVLIEKYGWRYGPPVQPAAPSTASR